MTPAARASGWAPSGSGNRMASGEAMRSAKVPYGGGAEEVDQLAAAGAGHRVEAGDERVGPGAAVVPACGHRPGDMVDARGYQVHDLSARSGRRLGEVAVDGYRVR